MFHCRKKRKETRLGKYKEYFTELSLAAKVVMRGEKLVLPKALSTLKGMGSPRGSWL